MSTRMVAISNKILSGKRCGLSHDASGLYMIIASLLSVPNYTFPKHGFKNRVIKGLVTRNDKGHIVCKNKKAHYDRLAKDGHCKMEKAWRELYDQGLLKRIAVPLGHNCFMSEYRLSYVPDFNVKAKIYYNIRSYLKSINNDYYTAPNGQDKETYTYISTAVLNDARLSMLAKFLWATIRRLQDIEKNKKQKDHEIITKSRIEREMGIGSGFFRGAWKMLCQAGYLHIIPVRGRGIQYHEFVLYNEPTEKVDKNITYVNPRANKKTEIKQTVIDNAGIDNTTIFTSRRMTRNDVLLKIKNNIGYDYIMAETGRGHLKLRRFLNEYIQLIVDVICSKRKSYHICGEDIDSDLIRQRLINISLSDIESIINQVESPEKEIKNPKSYRISALYNIVSDSVSNDYIAEKDIG